jgi:glycosyltransferase involved in cell wall biosynthesis
MFSSLARRHRIALHACKSVRLRSVGKPLGINGRRFLRGVTQRFALGSLAAPFLTNKLGKAGGVSHKFLVSIIIPVYNNAEYLSDCIKSALKQDSNLCEVLVCNDASPDPKVKLILAQLKTEHPNLRLFDNLNNQGISTTQNFLIDQALGEFIGFLDCDDELAPNAIEEVTKHLTSNVQYLHTATEIYDHQQNRSQIESSKFFPKKNYFFENRHMFFAKHWKIIRKSAIFRVGGFRRKYDAAQDLDIALKIAFYFESSCFKYVDKPVYRHRIHPHQTTKSKSSLQDLSSNEIQREADVRYLVNQGAKNDLGLVLHLKPELFQVALTPEEQQMLEECFNNCWEKAVTEKLLYLSLCPTNRSPLDGWIEEASAVFDNDSSLIGLFPQAPEIPKAWSEAYSVDPDNAAGVGIVLFINTQSSDSLNSVNRCLEFFKNIKNSGPETAGVLYTPAICFAKIN